MEEVYDKLYVGSDYDYAMIAAKPGWSCLRCCKYGIGGHQDILGYTTLAAPKGPHYLWAQSKRKGGDHLLALNMLDLDDPNFFDPGMIGLGLQYITDRIASGEKVLVACNKGKSRAPSMALMYLRSIGELPHHFIKAEDMFHTIYPEYEPGIGIRQFARSNWHELRPDQNQGS